MEFKMQSEIESLKETHEKSVADLASDLKHTKAKLRHRERRLEKLVNSLYGYCSHVRKRELIYQN